MYCGNELCEVFMMMMIVVMMWNMFWMVIMGVGGMMDMLGS